MTNLLPLYTWFEIIGFHPWHAFGIAGTGDLAVNTGCNTLVRRYEWQNSDAVGTKAIEQAIETAESKLTQYLGYSPAPHYVIETLPWPRLADGGDRWGAAGGDWRWLTVQTTEGQVRAVGVETVAAISPNAAVTYSDEDGDGIDDTFTISAATTITDTSQIAAYFSTADRFNGFGSTTALSPRWRVQPITISISGGTVTIRGPKQLCVKPIKYEGVVNIGSNGLDPATAGNFVTTLDIYQRYTAIDGQTVTTSQAVITWETRPSHGWWCCCDGCVSQSSAFSGSPYDPAAVSQAVARAGIRDARRGLLTPSESSYDATTGIWSSLDWTVCSQPDRVTLRYLAGWPLGSDGQMQEPFRTIVARLAAAELARPVCGCDAANRELYRWQFDVSQTARGDELFGISQENLNNPLGTRRGHVQAWKFIMDQQQLTGILA
jgi:hypothetical protein